jgi:hypothetical protein
MNTVNFQQLPSLLLPLVQMVVTALPPGLPPYVTFGANVVVRILQSMTPQAMAAVKQRGVGHPLALPAHLPELPPQEEWTPEGLKAWAEQHAE